jgi:hypothetical protein
VCINASDIVAIEPEISSLQSFGEADASPEQLLARRQPAVLRGIAANWPAVAAAKQGHAAAAAYLERFNRGVNVEAFVGAPEMDGRYFYNAEVSGFNFDRGKVPLSQLLAMLSGGNDARRVYSGSLPVRQVLAGFEAENSLPLVGGKDTEPRIWIGNQSRVAPHFDESDNIACVVAGRRRFTLFPPEQVANLYIGPLDFTVAGQPTSMVDLAAPDLEQYPRFAEALRHALVADLEPGDAIFIPALWWHGVQSTEPFNILVNYWWQDVPRGSTSAFPAMVHGIFALRELPAETREAWRTYFDHFVFQREGDPANHLPAGRRGILDQPNPQLRARLRQFLVRVLSSG